MTVALPVLRRQRLSFPTRAIGGAVLAKALLMGVLVSLLASTTFVDSLVLVVVSATATGIFGLVIALVQIRAERGLHLRIDSLEGKADVVIEKAETIEGAVTAAPEDTSS